MSGQSSRLFNDKPISPGDSKSGASQEIKRGMLKVGVEGIFKNKGDFEKLCFVMGYQFRKPELLARALTTEAAFQKGFQKKFIGHQELPEFFGDSLLRMEVSYILREEFPYCTPGQLTQLRDQIVKNANLTQAAKKWGLQRFIIMDEFQQKKVEEGRGDKILADTMEAIIDSMYLDSGNDLRLIRRFILSNSNIAEVLKERRIAEAKRNAPLFDAIEISDPSAVERCFQQGLNPNAVRTRVYEEAYESGVYPREELTTPLALSIDCLKRAVQNGKDFKTALQVTRILLQHEADVNFCPQGHRSVICDVIPPIDEEGRHENADILDILSRMAEEDKAAGKPPNVMTKFLEKTKHTKLPLWGQVSDEVVKLFCQHDLDPAIAIEAVGLAITYNLPSKVDLFLDFGIDPNQQNRRGKRLLHLAAEGSKLELIRQLIKRGALVNLTDREGNRAFDLVINIDIKKELLQAEIGEHQASVSTGKEQKDNPDIEEIDKQAVLYCSQGLKEPSLNKLKKATELFEQVLAARLRVLPYRDVKLASHYYNLGSVYFHRRDYVKALPFLERAYVICLLNLDKDHEKTTKMRMRLEECRKLLKEMNDKRVAGGHHSLFQPAASPSAEDQRAASFAGKTLEMKLHEAVSIYQDKAVENLLRAGIDPDTRVPTEKPSTREEYEPILNFAIAQCQSISSMADASRDIDYTQIMTGSLQRGSMRVVELLLEAKASTNGRDREGRAALHVASTAGLDRVVMQLLRCKADPYLADHKGNYPSHLAKDDHTRNIILKALVPAEAPEAGTQLKA